jgi:hypothetical protein
MQIGIHIPFRSRRPVIVARAPLPAPAPAPAPQPDPKAAMRQALAAKIGEKAQLEASLASVQHDIDALTAAIG